MKSCLTLLFLMVTLISNGQLIRNGNMEEDSIINENANCGKLAELLNWEPLNGNLHFISKPFNKVKCGEAYNFNHGPVVNSIPEGNQAAYISTHLFTGGESFGQWLNEPLIKGKQYNCKFKVAFNGNQLNHRANLITSFNTGKPDSISRYVYSDTFKMTTENKWYSYSICYIPADSGINYISFNSSYNTNNFNYPIEIFIDEVSLYLDTISLNISDKDLCKKDTIQVDLSYIRAHTYFWASNVQRKSRKSKMNIDLPGKYWVDVYYKCAFKSDTFNVRRSENPTVFLGNDTTLCPNDSIRLSSREAANKYLWQDGSKGEYFTVKEEGKYWIEITNSCDSFARDTINVNYIPPPEVDLGKDITICSDEILSFDFADTTLNYIWQDSILNKHFSIEKSGIYWVQAESDCKVLAYDTIKVDSVIIPEIAKSEILFNSSLLSITNTAKYDQYQWIHCDSSIILGANSPSYLAYKNGNYALRIESKGCTEFSNCIKVVNLEEIIPNEPPTLYVYPNPTDGKVFIKYDKAFDKMKITLRNVVGQFIFEKQFSRDDNLEFELSEKFGSYILEVQIDQEEKQYFRLIKR